MSFFINLDDINQFPETLLDVSPGWTAGWLIGLSIAVFVPLKYLYPSQMGAWSRITNAGAGVWILVCAALLAITAWE